MFKLIFKLLTLLLGAAVVALVAGEVSANSGERRYAGARRDLWG